MRCMERIKCEKLKSFSITRSIMLHRYYVCVCMCVCVCVCAAVHLTAYVLSLPKLLQESECTDRRCASNCLSKRTETAHWELESYWAING